MEKRRIDSFFVGGVIAKSQVGELLEALFSSGASHIDVAPFIEGMRPNGSLAEVESPKLLPPPHSARKSRSFAPLKGTAKSGPKPAASSDNTILIVKLLQAAGRPLRANAFVSAFVARGQPAVSVPYYLAQSIKHGATKRIEVGLYDLVETKSFRSTRQEMANLAERIILAVKNFSQPVNAKDIMDAIGETDRDKAKYDRLLWFISKLARAGKLKKIGKRYSIAEQ